MSLSSPIKPHKKRTINALVIAILIFLIGIVLGLFLNQLLESADKSIDIANSAIALGGLIVAFIAILTNFVQRVDPQRQSLYQAHLDVYQEIYYTILDVFPKLLEFAIGTMDEGKKAFVEKALNNFRQVSRRHWIILPAIVRDELIRYEEFLGKLYEKSEKEIDIPSTIKELGLSSIRVFNLMRETLGIEELHKETARLIGIPQKDAEK